MPLDPCYGLILNRLWCPWGELVLRINEQVELPYVLLDALTHDELVVFAGAGVSMAPPTNFPSFDQLVKHVQITAGAVPRVDGEPPDRYLGRLTQSAVPVPTETIVRRLFTNPEARYNDLHKYLLKLFETPARCRIVTTNFDPLFSRAAARVYGTVPTIYHAPALPRGRDFNGLVYLHGEASQSNSLLVLDDRHFGMAYLTEGWARRFIVDVFLHYVVLFVGYSHDDTIMQYLARGLPPDAKPRFAFTEQSDSAAEHWTRLGIQPVEYPLGPRGGRRALVVSIKDWVRLATKGYLQRNLKIDYLLSEDPPAIHNADTDWLLWFMKEQGTLRYALSRASADWLLWFDERGLLGCLLDNAPGSSEEESREWIECIVRLLVAGDEDSTKVLGLIGRHGGHVPPALWARIGQQLAYGKQAISSHVVATWVQVLISTCPDGMASGALVELSHNPAIAGSPPLMLTIMDVVSRPTVRIEQASSEPTYYASPTMPATADGFRNAWAAVWRPLIRTHGGLIYRSISRQLEVASGMSVATSQANIQFDPISHFRDQIATQSGIDAEHDWAVLIDAARDLIDDINPKNPEYDEFLHGWSVSSSPTLRRLFLYGLQASKMTPDRKLQELCDPSWVTSLIYRREMVDLLKTVFCVARQRTRNKFLKVVEDAHRVERETVVTNYMCYLLHLSVQWCPEDQTARRGFDRVRKLSPTFDASAYDVLMEGKPDTLFMVPATTSGEQLLAMDPVDVLGLVAKAPVRWYASAIARAVQEDFVQTWTWVKTLVAKAYWNHPLWSDLLIAWARMEIGPEQWKLITTCLSEHEELASIAGDVGHLYVNAYRKDSASLPRDVKSQLDDLVDKLSGALRTSSEVSDAVPDARDHNWLNFAISHPSGAVATLMMYRLADLQDSGDGRGTVAHYLSVLTAMLSGTESGDIATRVIVAQNVGFLVSVDKDWVAENLVPRFSVADEGRARARQIWHGYLGAGNWTWSVIPSLLPYYRQLFSIIASEPSETAVKQFYRHMALLAVYWQGATEPGWLNEFLSQASDNGRQQWAEWIQRDLHSMSPASRDTVWDGWLKGYWERRLTGIPVPLSPRELGAMIQWGYEFGHSRKRYQEAVNLIVQGPSGNERPQRMAYNINTNNLVNLAPADTLKLVRYVLHGVGPNEPFDRRDIESIALTARSLGAPEANYQAVLEELARLG